MSRPRGAVWSALAASLAALVLALPAAAAPLPPGFFGVVPQGPLSAGDLARIGRLGVTVRMPVNWYEIETGPGDYDFETLDREVGEAAAHGVRVLPFVYGTPAWLAAEPSIPPLASARARDAWRAFLVTLVERYGPGGVFWKSRPAAMPIRRWQVWNEPNFRLFWRPHPAPRQYAQLLGLAADAIRGADPGAKIVLGGVAPVGAGFLPWVYLRQLYRVPGVKADFDFVALHPYSVRVGNAIAQVRVAREVIEAAGDSSTPILITELGIASSGSLPTGFVVGEAGQAQYLHEAFAALLAKRRAWRIAGIDWFTWRDQLEPDLHCGFCQGAGLFDLDGRAKLAWYAFKAAVRAGVR